MLQKLQGRADKIQQEEAKQLPLQPEPQPTKAPAPEQKACEESVEETQVVETPKAAARPVPTPARAIQQQVIERAISSDAQPREQDLWDETFRGSNDVPRPETQTDEDEEMSAARSSADSDEEAVGMASCLHEIMFTASLHVSPIAKSSCSYIRILMSFGTGGRRKAMGYTS